MWEEYFSKSGKVVMDSNGPNFGIKYEAKPVSYTHLIYMPSTTPEKVVVYQMTVICSLGGGINE